MSKRRQNNPIICVDLNVGTTPKKKPVESEWRGESREWTDKEILVDRKGSGKTICVYKCGYIVASGEVDRWIGELIKAEILYVHIVIIIMINNGALYLYIEKNERTAMSLQIVKAFASLLSMLLLLERWPVPPSVSPDNGDNLKQTPKQHTHTYK